MNLFVLLKISLHLGQKARCERLDRDEPIKIEKIKICILAGGPQRNLQFSDITLHVRVKRGSQSESDVNCDTKFMLESIGEVGRAIRDKMNFVPEWEPIYLFIDNAGGHGTNEGKSQYEKILLEDHNIILVWQVPQSPETNMLDLGAWMSIQSVVEVLHRQRCMNEDALAATVLEAFDQFDGYNKLAAIAKRWELVLDLILEDNGGNDKVETRRGNLTKGLGGRLLPRSDIYEIDRVPIDIGDSDDDINVDGAVVD